MSPKLPHNIRAYKKFYLQKCNFCFVSAGHKTSCLQGAVHSQGSFCAPSQTELTTCEQIQNCDVNGHIQEQGSLCWLRCNTAPTNSRITVLTHKVIMERRVMTMVTFFQKKIFK